MAASPKKKKYTKDDLNAIAELGYAKARFNFADYRRFIHPGMKWGWFLQEVAEAFQQFYDDLEAGKRPKLALMTPPQHGKSFTVEDFISWVAGRNPDIKTIFASYSDDLGARANLGVQRTIMNPLYQSTFFKTNIGEAGWMLNSTLIEFCHHKGSFRNTTVGGPINGMALDLGIIDDPVKGRAEASSKAMRDKVWNWFTDDFLFRFADRAGLIVVMTRWVVDDMLGRAFEHMPDWKVLKYPAIATHDEKYRFAGEALFPEFKSLEFLMDRKKSMSLASWEAEAQQSPIVVGGDMFPVEKIRIVGAPPDRKEIKKTVRYWDKAGTEGGGAFTAGVRLHNLKEGGIVISDVLRGQWSALEREKRIKQTAEIDNQILGGMVETWVEQEPGSGGKESAERTILMLKGFNCKADKVTGSKEARAEPYAAQVQAGNVALVGAQWNREFIDEHEVFPAGKYRDQVDAAGGAFTKATSSKYGSYDSSMDWVGGPAANSRPSLE